MSEYRIVCTTSVGSYHVDTYIVQKRSFLGIWYNFQNTDAYETGVYQNIENAKFAIDSHRTKITKSYMSY